MIERGTAAQGVPVRQIRVAELDDDVAVLSAGQPKETKRDWRLQHLSRDGIPKMRSEDYAGEDSSSVWQLEEILAREKFAEPARSEKHTFSRVTVAKPATTKKSRELERTSREPDFGSQRIRFFHGNGNKTVSTLLSSKHEKNLLNERRAAQRRVTKQERRRRPGVGNEHFSICKNRCPRRSDRRRRETHRSSWLDSKSQAKV